MPQNAKLKGSKKSEKKPKIPQNPRKYLTFQEVYNDDKNLLYMSRQYLSFPNGGVCVQRDGEKERGGG